MVWIDPDAAIGDGESHLPRFFDRDREEDEKYDVILLDAVTPGVCAADLIAQIKATSANLPPIIYITGLALERQQAGLMETGAVGDMTKPFDPLPPHRPVRQLIDATVTSDDAQAAAQAA